MIYPIHACCHKTVNIDDQLMSKASGSHFCRLDLCFAAAAPLVFFNTWCPDVQVFHFSESKDKDDQDTDGNSKAAAQSEEVDATPLSQSKKIS